MSSRRPSKQFPFDAKYDFGFRPETYWPNTPSEDTVLSKIKGSARRDIARRALEGEELVRGGEAADFVLQEKLEDDERDEWGGIHPWMLGGEFLPDAAEDEVEIARIELASTTFDVIQVLARREGEQIRYRAVDEYSEDGSCYQVAPETSTEPLTLAELIDLMDTARQVGEWQSHDDRLDVGLIDPILEAHLAYDQGREEVESLRDFVTVTSGFYPQLVNYYVDRTDALVDAAAT